MDSTECRLTILTPTYNRGRELRILAESLNEQIIKGFQWLVIDDGSTDDTKNFINSVVSDGFIIEYHYKENGGKHTALNYSHQYISGRFICIVDSDDMLTKDAVENIYQQLDLYEDDQSIGCISFQKALSDKVPLVHRVPDNPVISDHISFRLNGDRPGDCFEVVRTNVFKQYPFPVFPGEKFMSEGYLWTSIALKYNTVYMNKVIYICDYMNGGLTRSGRSMRMKNPRGGMVNCNTLLSASLKRGINFKLVIKEILLYIVYGKCADMNYYDMKQKCACPRLMTLHYPLGVLLYHKWR